MKVENEQVESLSGKNQLHLQQDRHIPTVNNTKTNLLTLFIIFVTVIVVYQMTQRIFSLSHNQQQVKNSLEIYHKAVLTLQQKLKNLNASLGKPFTDEEHQTYEQLMKKIKQMEDVLLGKNKNTKRQQPTKELIQKAKQVEILIDERQVVINTLVSHSKEQIRKKKIEMFDKIAKKQDFKQQKLRNTWALSKLNIKTPYVDTLERRHMEEEVQKEAERLEDKYHFSQYDDELPLCIIVTTRNNVKNYRFQYNLQSIINQNYENYKLVIIDDASDDGTGDLIELFLKKSKFPPERYSFIRNKERKSAVPNIHNAIKNYCSKDDIAVLVSGDDELLGKLVFKVLNVVYQTKKPGLAYTNHFYGKLHQKDFDKGYSRTYSLGQIKNKLYRFIGQKFGHMRTFPVSIFLEIKEEHMKYRDGNWVQATYDETFILPILEMACDSIQYIDEYVYLYNYGTGQNDGEIHHDIQSKAALYVRELPRYSCLERYQKYVI